MNTFNVCSVIVQVAAVFGDNLTSGGTDNATGSGSQVGNISMMFLFFKEICRLGGGLQNLIQGLKTFSGSYIFIFVRMKLNYT